jgi:hypothetical protein
VTGTEFTVRAGLAVGAALIAYRFKTRERSAAAFARLNLDRISGVGLAIVLVLAAAITGTFIAR